MNSIYWEEFVYIFRSIAIVLLSSHKNNLYMTHAKYLHDAIDHLGENDHDYRMNNSVSLIDDDVDEGDDSISICLPKLNTLMHSPPHLRPSSRMRSKS